MCRVTGSGWHCERVGPRGGLNAVRGAMIDEGLSLQNAGKGKLHIVPGGANSQPLSTETVTGRALPRS